jgi:hypothetical protein
MQATWGIGTTLKVPTDLTGLFAVANEEAAIRQRLLHEALAKDRCNHGHYQKNGLVHWSSHSQSTHQMLLYYLSALEMQRPSMIPCRRFHRSVRERPNTLLSQSLHFSETARQPGEGHGERIRFYVRGSGHPHAAGWDAGSPPGAGIRSPTVRLSTVHILLTR